MTFEQRTDAFKKWLLLNEVSISSKISIEDFRSDGQGRGIIATEDIEEDEEIFSIPRSKLLNLTNGNLFKSSSEAVQEKLLQLDQWESLILAILWEWKVKGSSSEWVDYINVLPLNDPSYQSDQLMYWDETELEFLKPSLIVERIGKSNTLEMYHKLFPNYVDELGLSELKEITQEEFEKVGSVIMSYSFDVEEEKEEGEEEDEDDIEEDEDEDLVKCMVPLADTLNADTNLHNANLIHTPESLIMKTTSKISKGNQVYNTYLDHPNAEILRRYGYVEYKGSKNDFGEVTLENIKDSFSESIPFVDDLFEIIHDEVDLDEVEEGVELLTESYDFYSTGEVIPEFILLVQFLVVIQKVNEKQPIVEEDQETMIKSIQRIFKKCIQLIEQGRLTNGFIELYKHIVQARLDQYDNTNAGSTNIDPMSREGMAMVVLKSESESLKNCLNTNEVFGKTFKFIEDDKLLRNILKKRVGEGEEGETKKQRKGK